MVSYGKFWWCDQIHVKNGPFYRRNFLFSTVNIFLWMSICFNWVCKMTPFKNYIVQPPDLFFWSRSTYVLIQIFYYVYFLNLLLFRCYFANFEGWTKEKKTCAFCYCTTCFYYYYVCLFFLQIFYLIRRIEGSHENREKITTINKGHEYRQ